MLSLQHCMPMAGGWEHPQSCRVPQSAGQKTESEISMVNWAGLVTGQRGPRITKRVRVARHLVIQ